MFIFCESQSSRGKDLKNHHFWSWLISSILDKLPCQPTGGLSQLTARAGRAVDGWYGFYRGSVPDVLGIGGVFPRAWGGCDAGGLPQTVRTLGTVKKEVCSPMVEGRLAFKGRFSGRMQV